MTNAGWYPDPAGAPDTYRYWDGQAWSQMTTTQPPAAPGQPGQPGQPGPQGPQGPAAPPSPPPGAPQPAQPTQYGAVPPPPPGFGGAGGPAGPGAPGGYGQPAWASQPAKKGGNGKVIGVVVAAVLALVLIGVGGFFGVRALTGDDDGGEAGDKPTNVTSNDSSDGTEDPSGSPSSTIAPTGIQCTGGDPTPKTDPAAGAKTISGGGLTIPVLNGFTVENRLSDAFSFADAFSIQYANISESWIWEFAVGGLAKANDFTSPAQAAEIVMQCMTANDRIYSSFKSRTDLKNEAVKIDGKDAHQITAEIRVEDPKVPVEGDVTTVVVVETGAADTYGLYVGAAPIGDATKIAQAESMVGQIKVQ